MLFKSLRALCLLALFILVAATLQAAQKSPRPLDVKDLGRFTTKVMEEWKIPGLAMTIVKDGKTIYSEGFGFRDVERGLKVTPETLFNFGSNSKGFTATTVGILVDEKKLDWDKPVKDYLPVFELKDPVATLRATPRDLLTHRTGLPRHDAVWDGSSATRLELVKQLRFLPPSADFRQKMQYTNNLITAAAYLVEHVSEKSWEAFVQERILQPLGMNDTNFTAEDYLKASNFALPYTVRAGKFEAIPYHNVELIGPAAAMNMTITDAAKWLLLNLNKGKYEGKQIISEASLSELHSPQVVEGPTVPYFVPFYQMYGMGWRITNYRGYTLLYHGGGIDGFRAEVFLMPEKNIGMAVFCNMRGMTPKIIGYYAFDRMLGLEPMDWNSRFKDAQAGPPSPKVEKRLNTTPSHPLADYTGDYRHPGYGLFAVKMVDNSLVGTYNNSSYQMAHFHFDTFELVDSPRNLKVTFFTDAKGHIKSLSTRLEPAVDEIVFIKVPAK